MITYYLTPHPPDLLPELSEHTLDLHRTFPSLSYKYSSSSKYQNHLITSSPLNDHQQDLNAHNDPFAFTKIFCC
jgi:hypothetical protein